MSTAVVRDLRRLTLPTDTVVDALLEFDRDHSGQLWRNTHVTAEVRTTDDDAPEVLLVLRSAPEAPPVERCFSAREIAAAVISYCGKAQIPVPRRGTKSLEAVEDGIAFTIEMVVHVQRRHRSDPAANSPAPAGDQT